MSDGKVSYIIALKDLASSSLRKIRVGIDHVAGGIKKLGGMSLSGLASSFRRLSVVAAGTGAGLVYYAARASKAWLDKTQSLGEVRRALVVTGQATETNGKKLGQLSDWLQSVANVADDAGDAAIAYALRLGVGANEMDSFMKSAVGLSRVLDTDLLGATNLLIKADQGTIEALKRKGIAIDETKSKEEQAIEIKKKMLQAFNDGIAAVNDAGSKWQNFKLRVDDVTKGIGQNIVAGLNLERVIDILRGGAAKLIDALQKPDNPFRAWVVDVRNLAVDIAAVLKALSTAEGRQSLGKDMADLFTAGVADAGSVFMDAMGMAVSLLVKAAPVIGRLIGEAAKKALGLGVEGTSADRKQATRELIAEGKMTSRRSAWAWDKEGSAELRRNVEMDNTEVLARARSIRAERERKESGFFGESASTEGPRKSRTEEVWDRIRSSGTVSKARGDLERQAAELEAIGKETPKAPDFSDVTGPAGASAPAAASRTAAGGGGFDFLDHARALGTEIKEWKPGEKTMTDLYTVMENVERNTRDVSKLLEQE